MKKTRIALEILLAALVLCICALVIMEIKCFDWHGNDGNGLLFAVTVLLNIIPMIGMIVLGAVFALLFILLLALKKKGGTVIATLVMLCILLPFAGFSAFVDISALTAYPEVPILAVVTLLLDIAAITVSATAVREIRRMKRAAAYTR